MLKDLARRRAEVRLETVRSEMTFYERVARLHARGESVPSIVVEEGETVEEVRAREGIRQAMITQQDRMAVASERLSTLSGVGTPQGLLSESQRRTGGWIAISRRWLSVSLLGDCEDHYHIGKWPSRGGHSGQNRPGKQGIARLGREMRGNSIRIDPPNCSIVVQTRVYKSAHCQEGADETEYAMELGHGWPAGDQAEAA